MKLHWDYLRGHAHFLRNSANGEAQAVVRKEQVRVDDPKTAWRVYIHADDSIHWFDTLEEAMATAVALVRMT